MIQFFFIVLSLIGFIQVNHRRIFKILNNFYESSDFRHRFMIIQPILQLWFFLIGIYICSLFYSIIEDSAKLNRHFKNHGAATDFPPSIIAFGRLRSKSWEEKSIIMKILINLNFEGSLKTGIWLIFYDLNSQKIKSKSVHLRVSLEAHWKSASLNPTLWRLPSSPLSL
jgi:hypothetical protein